MVLSNLSLVEIGVLFATRGCNHLKKSSHTPQHSRETCGVVAESHWKRYRTKYGLFLAQE